MFFLFSTTNHTLVEKNMYFDQFRSFVGIAESGFGKATNGKQHFLDLKKKVKSDETREFED